MMAVIPLMMLHSVYWIGICDIRNNNTFVWVQTGEVIPDTSGLWGSWEGVPLHGSDGTYDCVGLLSNLKLYDGKCTNYWSFICEAIIIE